MPEAPPETAPDDASIPDDARLLRRIPMNNVYVNDVVPDGRGDWFVDVRAKGGMVDSTSLGGVFLPDNGADGNVDFTEANIFVTDNDLNLVYLNDKARTTLRALEPQLRQALGLGLDDLVGASLYRMHADRAALQRLADGADARPRNVDFTFGAVTLGASMSPVGTGEGFVFAWADITSKVDGMIRAVIGAKM